jgi:site-specific recombinase XerD
MLTTYFKRQTTWATYYAGPAGPYLDGFTDWLAQRGYRQKTIRNRLQGASQLGTWAQKTGLRLQSLSTEALNDFRHYLSDRSRLHLSGGQLSIVWLGAQLFLEFLQAKRLVAPTDVLSAALQPELLGAFEHWMLVHRGVRPSTLVNYRRHLIDLLTHLGEVPEQFNAAQLRTFILMHAERSSLATAKTRVKATRAFLRFLIATGRCPTGLEAAIPALAEW